MVLRVASFFPFQTAYYLNGHSLIEQELKRAGIGFRKHDNAFSAFLAVADPAALQAAADRLSPEVIRRRLDYWTLILGPKFSKKERAQLNLSRLYAISQIEYRRNFVVIDQIERGHHVFRAYFKSAFLKQYEKFSTFLPTRWSPMTSMTSA
jgi:hypothetical protein